MKQDQFFQTKFNPSRPNPNLSGTSKPEPRVPETQGGEKRLRFAPKLEGTSERDHAQPRGPHGQSEEMGQTGADPTDPANEDASQKPQIGNALLNKDTDESKNRMAQMLDQNRPRLGKKPTSDNTKVIFGKFLRC